MPFFTGSPPLACTVRGCGNGLTRQATAWTCSRGHAFDIARRGYVNLLQPQDRRRRDAGDPIAAVDARLRLTLSGVNDGLVATVADLADTPAPLSSSAVVVDLGCGTGQVLDAIGRRRGVGGIGIDLSTHAIELAAARFPERLWVVANADRRLPLLDDSVDLVLSINARRNAPEARRVLKTGGRLLLAVPADDDLIELREAAQGQRIERDRVAALIDEHAPAFTVVSRATVKSRHVFEAAQLLDLLDMTYRGTRHSVVDRIAGIDRLEVTLASEIVELR